MYGRNNTLDTNPTATATPVPTKKRWRWILLVVMLLILSGVGIVGGYLLYQSAGKIMQTHRTIELRTSRSTVQQAIPTSIPPSITPTAQSTIQPTQARLYTAEDIYNAFVTAGIGGTIDNTPDYWSCCLYRPEGGSERWQRSDGSQWEVASFVNSQEAHDDAFALNKSMDGPGLATNIGRCILVSGPLSTDLIPKYETIMKKYC